MISAEIERCAGIDVGKKFLAVCILVGPLQGEPRVEHRRFGTTVVELEALRGWLQQEGITPVAMESTGAYWKPVFNVWKVLFKYVWPTRSRSSRARDIRRTKRMAGGWPICCGMP